MIVPPLQHAAGGEAALVLPDLNQATFLGGIGGRALLLWGLVICALGLLFGLAQYTQLKNLPVHRAMREDRKSTRLNSSHSQISYAVFCLKKKKKKSACCAVAYSARRRARVAS